MDVYVIVAMGFVGILLVLYYFRGLAPVSKEEVVPKVLYDQVLLQQAQLKSDLVVCEQKIRDLLIQVATRDQQIIHLKTQQEEAAQAEVRLKASFENLANRLLDQKGEQITRLNAQQLQLILQPLREKIKDFEEHIDRKFTEETREKSSLKKEIEQLRDMNLQLSQDAHNLTNALKGQSKVQGDWGEFQLEVLLEKAGLQRGVHFIVQSSFRDDEGSLKRPDFIIHLPDDKHLIVDSKVSLTAYERYYNDPDPSQKDKYLKAHIDSIRAHVEDLSKKNYQSLSGIHSPDYLLMFIPLDAALTTATHADPKLFTDALDRNIVLVTAGSLLATMRTVSHLWRQEKQSKSVQEIARQSGLLYDKFVAFVEDLRLIGTRLDQARQSYDDAMNKLSSASRPGDTLIGKAERIRELGAKTTKSLPLDL
ncbi:MAG: DNA recombination protein RmuC [Chitinophagales bacterium]|jgi:DNA recombination protein RmuC